MKPLDENTPKDRLIIVFAPGKEFDLPDMISFVQWHPDAGFYIDELRYPTHWIDIPEGVNIETI